MHTGIVSGKLYRKFSQFSTSLLRPTWTNKKLHEQYAKIQWETWYTCTCTCYMLVNVQYHWYGWKLCKLQKNFNITFIGKKEQHKINEIVHMDTVEGTMTHHSIFSWFWQWPNFILALIICCYIIFIVSSWYCNRNTRKRRLNPTNHKETMTTLEWRKRLGTI